MEMRRALGGKAWRRALWGGAGLILLLPLAGMLVTRQVDWGAGDFAALAALLAAACGGFELAMRASGDRLHHLGAALALATAFLLVWMNLAVGIIGSEDDPANLTFFLILAAGVAGALATRFRPRGMAAVMLTLAVAQAGVGAVVLATGQGLAAVLTLAFAVFWTVSALLFRRAARRAQA